MRDRSVTNLTHDDAQAALPAAALGALDPAEQRALEAHLATCPECRADRAALLDVAASLSFARPGHPGAPSRHARIRGRLLERAALERGESVVARRSWVPAWMRIAAAVALLAAAAAIFALARSRTALRQELAATRTAAAAAVAAMADSLAERDRLLAGLTGRRVAVMELSAAAMPSATARMFWDRATDSWTLVAHGLPPAGAGRTYQLWLITAGGDPISGGTFDAGANGDAMMRMHHPMPDARLQRVAVTLEPGGGMPQPTGPIVVAGAATPN